MKSDEKLVVSLSKGNLIFGTVGSLLFVIMAIFIFINAVRNSLNVLGIFDIIISIVTILMFLFFFVMNAKKLFEKNPGLVISKQGIVENSSGTSLNVLISWKDVISVENKSNFFTKSIILHIQNHNVYLKKAKELAPNKLAGFNLSGASSRIVISPFGLAMSQDELYKIINDNFKKYGSKKRR